MKIEFKKRPAATAKISMEKIKLKPTFHQFQRWNAKSLVGLKPGEFPAILYVSEAIVPRAAVQERQKEKRAQDFSYQVTGSFTLNMTPETRDKIEKASRSAFKTPQLSDDPGKPLINRIDDQLWQGATIFNLANVDAWEMTKAQKAQFKKDLEEYWNR